MLFVHDEVPFSSSNRTFMELKLHIFHPRILANGVLIVPLWN